MASPAVGRIRRRATFRALRRPEGRATRGPIRISFVSPSADPTMNSQFTALQRPAVAFAVGRRCGTAVARNRLRRRLRAAVAEAAGARPLHPGSYLVIPQPEAMGMTQRDLVGTLGSALAAAAERAGAGGAR